MFSRQVAKSVRGFHLKKMDGPPVSLDRSPMETGSLNKSSPFKHGLFIIKDTLDFSVYGWFGPPCVFLESVIWSSNFESFIGPFLKQRHFSVNLARMWPKKPYASISNQTLFLYFLKRLFRPGARKIDKKGTLSEKELSTGDFTFGH